MRLYIGPLDFVANVVLEWVLYHLIKWVEAHKQLTVVIGLLITVALFLVLR
jgi:hypothetical protein